MTYLTAQIITALRYLKKSVKFERKGFLERKG